MSGVKTVEVGGRAMDAHTGMAMDGLTLAGTAAVSGASGGITTTAKKIDWDRTRWPLDLTKGRPVHMRLRCVAQTLTLTIDGGGAVVYAANEWTPLIPITRFFEGTQGFSVVAGASAAMEYEIYFM